MRTTSYLFGVLTLIHGALTWGDLGHRTVVNIAYAQLSRSSRSYMDKVLELTNGQHISDFASWPDTIRRQRPWTGPFHYIGSEQQDSPPKTCSLNYAKDCSKTEGCIVSALANYTRIFVDSPPSLTTARREALYFVIHFFGDIHQPLHAENTFRGGNDLPVLFNGSRANLHSVWDEHIARTLAGVRLDPETREPLAGEEKAVATKWAEQLLQSRGPGTPYERGCLDVNRVEFCATSWAVESNGLVCSYVMAKGVDWLRGRELGGEYYKGAIPVVEGQIHRAGVRLGDWLEAMVMASKAIETERSVTGSLEL